MPDTDIFWFRGDLRLRDQPALTAIADAGHAVVLVFISDTSVGGRWARGAAADWWLHHSLLALRDRLAEAGIQLVIRSGRAAEVLPALASECGADSVRWNRQYEPAVVERDEAVAAALRGAGVTVTITNASLLHDPDRVRTGSGGPYRVFTPFWRKLQAEVAIEPPLPAATLTPCGADLPSETVESLGLLPDIRWDAGFVDFWEPGEDAAHVRLRQFVDDRLADYPIERNRPDHDGTSQLSPRLHFGELSPRQVVHAVREHVAEHPDCEDAADVFVSEIGWREFAHHVLHHFPETPDRPLRDQFEKMPWRDDPDGLRAWQRGRTGYPIVDAGMRQLWHIGWMHNRVRMIVGSFLTKDQLISWERGAEWFFDTLCDGDLANNTLGWQWVAGCGADASPYFRVFNPVSQGQRYDPEGDYVRTWVPELAEMPAEYIHRPWEAPAAVLAEAGVTLGDDYPKPIVDHGEARKRALKALASTK